MMSSIYRKPHEKKAIAFEEKFATLYKNQNGHMLSKDQRHTSTPVRREWRAGVGVTGMCKQTAPKRSLPPISFGMSPSLGRLRKCTLDRRIGRFQDNSSSSIVKHSHPAFYFTNFCGRDSTSVSSQARPRIREQSFTAALIEDRSNSSVCHRMSRSAKLTSDLP